MNEIGLGNPNATFRVFIENKPPIEPYQSLNICLPLKEGEINKIAEMTGNHWRKIFNVYAKLIFELTSANYSSWQTFRDQALLQKESDQNLLFSRFTYEDKKQTTSNKVNLIMGKTYASKLGIAEKSQWLSPDFAIIQEQKVIICPYFDYRQLSNVKISQLCGLIQQLA